MILLYSSLAMITSGVIFAANRVTGVNVPYAIASGAMWPAWWLRWMFTEEA